MFCGGGERKIPQKTRTQAGQHPLELGQHPQVPVPLERSTLNICGNYDFYLDCFASGNYYRFGYCFALCHCLNNWIPYQRIYPMALCIIAVRKMMWAMSRPFCACYRSIGTWLAHDAFQRPIPVGQTRRSLLENSDCFSNVNFVFLCIRMLHLHCFSW